MSDHSSLIEDFATKSKQVEEGLQAALEIVAAGKVPSEDDSLSLITAMSELRKSYSEVKTAAKLLKSEVHDGLSVYEYESVFREYAAKQLEDQISAIASVLEQFLLVSSDSEKYSEALKPYQLEAGATLKELQSPDVPIDAKLKIECRDQDVFLSAVTIDDLDSPEGEELLDILEGIYSRDVCRGVYFGKYSVPEKTDPAEPLVQVEHIDGLTEAALDESENGSVTEIEEGPEGESLEDSEEVKQESASANDSKEIEGKQQDGSVNNHTDGAEREDEIEFFKSINPIKANAKVNASSFKNDLKSLNGAVRDVLPALSKFGALASELLVPIIELIKGESEDDYAESVQRAIEALQKKSVISTFSISDSSVAYALTKYGRASLDRASIKDLKLPGFKESFWSSPICNHEFTADATVDSRELLKTLFQNTALFIYLQTARSRRDSEAISKLISGIRRKDGSYLVPVQWGYQDYSCILKSSADGSFSCEDDILFVALNEEKPSIEINDSENVFLVEGGTLYKWNGAWVEEGSDSFAQAVSVDAQNSDAEESSTVAEEGSENDEQSEEGVFVDKGSQETVEENADQAVEATPDVQIAPSEHSAEMTHESDETRDPEKTIPLSERFGLFAEQADCPSDREFVAMANELLESDQYLVDPEDEFSNLAASLALLKAASAIEENEESRQLLKQLILATNVKIEPLDNTGSVIARAFPEYTESNEALVFSAYCFALFAPHRGYDYDLKNAVDMFLESFEEVFPSLIAFKPLLNELSGIFAVSPEEGLSDNVLDMMGNQAKRSQRIAEMKTQAEMLMAPPKIKAKLHGLPEFIASCFGRGSDLLYCMQVIASNNRKEADFVKAVLDEYYNQDESGRRIDESAIGSKIDDEWRTATEGKSTSRLRKLGSEPRKKTTDGFRARLALMEKWLSYDEGKVDQDALSKLKSIKESLALIVEETERAGKLTSSGKGGLALKWLLKSLGDKLNGIELSQPLFASFLKSSHVSLDDDMVPMIDDSFNAVHYYEPWRNVLRHLSSKLYSFEEVRELVFDEESVMFDNFRQLRHVNEVLGKGASGDVITERQIEDAEEAAENATEKFQDSLEIAYAYSQINEIQKEDLAHLLEVFQDVIFAREDYGCWKQFIAALQRQVEDMSKPQGEELSNRLAGHKQSLKRGARSTLLDEAERLLVEEMNFTVVEDYLNRYESGQTDLTDELSIKMHDPDLFAEFISDEVFKPLYDICVRSKGQAFASFAKDFARSRYPSEWTDRQKTSCEELIKAWPVSLKRGAGQSLVPLLKGIGIKARGTAEQVKKDKRELYRVTIKPEPSDRADYRHPISAFGTQVKSPLSVLVLYGNHTAQEIIDLVAAESIVGMAIVLINHPISLQVRRQMAEIFHTRKSKLTSFLLIDQVLALHLALHQETERLPLMLKCALPFTYYQPFVRDSGPTADEMFCGRERELRTIVDPNGASVVYGGRQLGKTALLERAKSLCMKPDEGEYAVYVSILNCETEDEVCIAISYAITRAGLSVAEKHTLRELCKDIDSVMKRKAVSRLLLLIDEADKFLANISDDGYSVLQPLVDLKRETKNNFKFVLAGLHNVSRAKNATSRNGIFGQLGEPLCIKPLAPSEALQLISRPLIYLGFQVDRYPHLETILTSTNYYPGILQFFGYTLVETMTKQYGDYYRASDGNPPYTLHREQLGAIMNRSDLNSSIKEKFRWSLELDPRYFMIARCMALMCYEQDGDPSLNGAQRGFSAEEIKEWADDLGIICLNGETPQSYVALLDEMRDMGILVRPVEEIARFRFRRNSFLNIIGSNEDVVLEDIDINNV